MLQVRLLCSDGDCAEEIEVLVESLQELDGLSCDCGYGLFLLEVVEVELV